MVVVHLSYVDSRTASHVPTQIAAYLDLRGESRFKSREYQQAAFYTGGLSPADDVLAFARARREGAR